MADDAAEIARIVEEQRAKPEDLKPVAAAPDPAPEPVAAPEPTPEPAAPAVEASAEGDGPPAPAEAEPAPTPKAKKTATDFLTGRVGNLSAKLTEAQAREAALQARLDAAEALLNAQRTTPAPDGQQPPAPAPAPQTVNPNTGRTYTPEEFQAAVRETARIEALNRQADDLYNTGATQFPDWKENIDVLNASGIMSQELVDATLALGDQKTGAAVMHKLGADLEEAQRIAQLSPVKMGVELAKLAAQVAQPAAQTRVSSAPAPIPTIRGGVSPVVDYAKLAESDSNDTSAYVEARRKAGDPWAMSRKDRAALNAGR